MALTTLEIGGLAELLQSAGVRRYPILGGTAATDGIFVYPILKMLNTGHPLGIQICGIVGFFVLVILTVAVIGFSIYVSLGFLPRSDQELAFMRGAIPALEEHKMKLTRRVRRTRAAGSDESEMPTDVEQ